MSEATTQKDLQALRCVIARAARRHKAERTADSATDLMRARLDLLTTARQFAIDDFDRRIAEVANPEDAS